MDASSPKTTHSKRFADEFGVWYVKNMLRLCGLNSRADGTGSSTWHTALIFASFTAYASGHLVYSVQQDLRDERTQRDVLGVVETLVQGTYYFGVLCIFRGNRRNFDKIVTIIEREFPKRFAHLRPHYEGDRRKIKTTLSRFFYAYCSVYAVILLSSLCMHHLSPSADPTNVDNLLYTCWLPWKMDTRAKFTFTYLLQMFITQNLFGFLPFKMAVLLYFPMKIELETKICQKAIAALSDGQRCEPPPETLATQRRPRRVNQFDDELIVKWTDHRMILNE